MANTFPGAVNTFTDVPAGTKQGVAIGSRTHREFHNDMASAIEADETKIGAGTSEPDAIHKMLKATAAGTTAWGYYGSTKIAEASGNGSSGVLEFTSIPSVFRDLELVIVGRTTDGTSPQSVFMTFEPSPTAGAYNHSRLVAVGTSPVAQENTGTTASILICAAPGSGVTAGGHASARILIPEYTNTSVMKTVLSHAHSLSTIGASGVLVDMVAGLWESTTAINYIRLTLAAGNWTTTTRATLYGRGAG